MTGGRPGGKPDADIPEIGKPDGKPEGGKPDTLPYPKPDIIQDQINMIKESEVDDATKESFSTRGNYHWVIGEQFCIISGFNAAINSLLSTFNAIPWKIIIVMIKSVIGVKLRNEKLEKELLSKLFTTMQSKEYLEQHQARMVSWHRDISDC